MSEWRVCGGKGRRGLREEVWLIGLGGGECSVVGGIVN